jgi:hypothetical protein
MPRQVLLAQNEGGPAVRYLLDVFAEGEHWTSTLAKLDPAGQPERAAVAPRFYGVTEEQARRRMLSVLENQYESIQIVGDG